MREKITLPGIGGSGPEHWQTLWEISEPEIRRFSPSSWNEPDLDDWMAALDRAIDAAKEPPILVAHSLACLMIAHWAATSPKPIAGAFLVAPPDPAGPGFPVKQAGSFVNPPRTPLPFPALMIASSDDPYGSADYARGLAAAWRSSIIEVGPLGHINSASGLGAWPTGLALLIAFESGLG